ncbi:multidrug effflux MFS transporter [Taibaiella koreensis]|uniref:multidrug effflux MFS transporter n=1 Tax=Taibaiella koreensis TaxID=1268548 RepID=UPI001F08B11A|nr:multidrug effflux MFS transporter [Taibaiella koreensis]
MEPQAISKRQYTTLILILGTLTALVPFSVDMYLPGFPAIAKDLKTTDARVSLTLTGFFLGISAGQLLYGPLLDRFGRKPPLYLGLLLYIIASVGCSFAGNIDMLILLRLVQAVGGCAAMVTSMSLVRDLFPVKDSARVFSLLILILGASPMIAPTAGSYITSAWGWQLVFVVLAVIGALVLMACLLWLPSPYRPDTTMSLRPRPILNGFFQVATTPQFYTYALTGALAFAGLFAYVSGSPLLFMKVFGLSDKVYGWVFAALSLGFIGMSQMNNVFLRYFSSEQIIRVALICYGITAVLLFGLAELHWLNLPLTITGLFLMLGCVGITNPNASAMCLAPFSRNAGSASAMMGALQMGLGALASVVISMFDKPSVLPVIASILVSALLSLTIFYLGKRKIVAPVAAEKGAVVPVH